MKLTSHHCLHLPLLLAGLSAAAFAQPALQPCSTEKVNHADCIFTLNRLYPVTFPTIQMSRGKKIIVQLQGPLAFETVTLDETSATLLPGTDQGATLLASAIPDLKGLLLSEAVLPGGGAAPFSAASLGNSPEVAKVNDDLNQLRTLLDNGRAPIDTLLGHITIVYGQLSQIVSPLPRPVPGPSGAAPALVVAPGTPDPWASFSTWRKYLLCELVGGLDCAGDPHPGFTNVLTELAGLQKRLPGTPAPGNPLLDQSVFDILKQQTADDVKHLPQASQQHFNEELNQISVREDNLLLVMSTLGVSLPAAQKDFQTYYQNIQFVVPPAPMPPTAVIELGDIFDPASGASPYPGFLGRQIAFSVNVVNLIATSKASVTTSPTKTSIATITILYADPRFETSAGVVFDFVHNRSFVNQTITNPVAGSVQTAGEIQIFETKTRPAVVPFVAGHYRIGNDFIMPIDHRRAAVYATGWVGLNPNNTLPEYGGGPTFSWRSFMISLLYARTHDTRLTAGSYVGQILCSPNPPAGSTLPVCTPAPPSPTTQTFTTNAFAIGFSVRLPTTFAPGTGGVSH